MSKVKILIYSTAVIILAPLVFILGAAFYSLVYSTIFMSDPIYKWDAAGLVGGFVAGGMTIFAGWLAFREAKRSNQDNNRKQTMNLLIEHMKAVNTVCDEIVKIYKRGFEIGALTVDHISIIEVAVKSTQLPPKHIAQAAQK